MVCSEFNGGETRRTRHLTAQAILSRVDRSGPRLSASLAHPRIAGHDAIAGDTNLESPPTSPDRSPRSTPIPGGAITFPAGALFGSLPIVDSTAGCRIIQSWFWPQPGSNNASNPNANARLSNSDRLPSGFEVWGKSADCPVYSISAGSSRDLRD